MIRLAYAAMAALLFGLFGSTSAVATARADASTVNAYNYDDTQDAAAPTATTSERGPPSTDDYGTSYDAAGHWPRGSSARPPLATSGATTIYTARAKLTQRAQATGTTRKVPWADVGELSSFQRSRVAAKSAPEVASGLERTGTALSKGDPFHRSVSWVVDDPAAQRFAIKGGDGVSRELYQLPGEVNGKSGVFEWIIDRSGTNPVINHQRFIPGGSVTGYPNQVVP